MIDWPCRFTQYTFKRPTKFESLEYPLYVTLTTKSSYCRTLDAVMTLNQI